MPPGQLDSAQLSVKWANEKIQEFELALDGFLEEHPCVFVREPIPNTNEIAYIAKLTAPFPEAMVRAAVECTQHLRAALDHVIFALAERNGVTLEKATFPFATDAKHLETMFNGTEVNAIGIDGFEIVAAAKPYPGADGKSLLCALNKLNNVNKHRYFVAVGGYASGSEIGEFRIDKLVGTFSARGARWKPLIDGIELYRYTADIEPEPNPEVRVSIRVSFGEPKVIASLPQYHNAITILKRIVKEVDVIVDNAGACFP